MRRRVAIGGMLLAIATGGTVGGLTLRDNDARSEPALQQPMTTGGVKSNLEVTLNPPEYIDDPIWPWPSE